MIGETLETIFKNKRDVIEAPERIVEKFREFSVYLNNILPEVTDEILFEIDDILYDDDESPGTNISCENILEPSAFLSDESILQYLKIYGLLVDWSIKPKSRVMDLTYLKFITNMPNILYGEKKFATEILYTINALNASRKTNNICLSLKITKLTHCKGNVRKYMTENTKYNISYMWMSNLTNIPEATHAKHKRVSSWIRKLATAIFGVIDPKSLIFDEYLKQYFDNCDTSKEQHFDVNYLQHMRVIFYTPLSNHFDDLLVYFMSAKDEEQKLQRLRDFIPGYDLEFSGFANIMSEFGNSFRFLYRNTKKEDDKLRNMERLYGFEVKPYLLSADNSNPYIGDIEDELKNDKSIPTHEKDDLHEADYTIEHFIFYEEFLKKMQIIDIAYTACITWPEQHMSKRLQSLFSVEELRLKTYLRNALIDPSKRGYIPWIVEILIKKFPYMIFSKQNQYLLKDLVRLLKGQYVDKLTVEEIHYAINSKTLGYS